MTSENKSIYFIVGAMRSGTTSLCNILNQASNGCCNCEPAPNLHNEARLFWENRLADPIDALKMAILPRASEAWRQGLIYGEKNLTLSIFMPQLLQIFPNVKFIYIHVDGRNCVNSMRNWHACMFGNIYREARHQPPLSRRAQEVIDNLPVNDDLSDYGRPRPTPEDPAHSVWHEMTHHQMLCWYWNAWNARILRDMPKIPLDRIIRIDYSAPKLAKRVLEVADFIGLKGLDAHYVKVLLDKNINSVEDRINEKPLCPDWRNWTDAEVDDFWRLANPAMKKLGYFTPNCPEQRRLTTDYGKWWQSAEVGHDFFESIYQDRIYQHEALFKWAAPLLAAGKIRSVAEIGCGHGIGYADFFSGIKYDGWDISGKEIEWCRKNRANPLHGWHVRDYIQDCSQEKYDLVFCQGTIENMYDMDALIRKMCTTSIKYVYLAGWYGFHDEIREHKYFWNETYKSYANYFSIPQAIKVFTDSGFNVIKVEKVCTGKINNPFESILIAIRENANDATETI